MPKGQVLEVVFKKDMQHQGMLIPWTLDELVAADHPVRTVSAVIDSIESQAHFAAL